MLWSVVRAISLNLRLPLFLPPTSIIILHPSKQMHFSDNIQQSTHFDCSIAGPTTISFNPSKKNLLTQSPAHSSSYEPCKPSPLTTYTLRLPNICSTDALPQYPKRRKLDTPPTVDYHACSTPNLSTTATSTQTEALINENTIKSTIWNVLDSLQSQGRLFTGEDRRAPIWAQEHAEKRLRLPQNTLDPWKEIIRKTTGRYYNHHGRIPLNWDVK